MFLQELIHIFERDLDKLSKEISSYKNDDNIWIHEGTINNTGGNLCIHLVGNLRHFIGHVIGHTSYERDRPYEFSARNIEVSIMLKWIESGKEEVIEALNKMDVELLDKEYPIEVFGKPMTYRFFLIHLSTHLSYHLGQINYHRRIIDGRS